MPKPQYPTLAGLLAAVRQCRVCEQHLPLGPRPVLQVGDGARILIVGQAPGTRVHASGTPWDDPSGERLRMWMGINAARFYDASQIAIIPIGYCGSSVKFMGELRLRKLAKCMI